MFQPQTNYLLSEQCRCFNTRLIICCQNIANVFATRINYFKVMLIDNKRRCLNGYSYQDVQINYSVELITTIPDWLLHLQKVITQTIIPDWLLDLQKVITQDTITIQQIDFNADEINYLKVERWNSKMKPRSNMCFKYYICNLLLQFQTSYFRLITTFTENDNISYNSTDWFQCRRD